MSRINRNTPRPDSEDLARVAVLEADFLDRDDLALLEGGPKHAEADRHGPVGPAAVRDTRERTTQTSVREEIGVEERLVELRLRDERRVRAQPCDHRGVALEGEGPHPAAVADLDRHFIGRSVVHDCRSNGRHVRIRRRSVTKSTDRPTSLGPPAFIIRAPPR